MKKEELESLIQQNYSVRQIASATGKSYSSIRHWLNKFDLSTNWVGKPAEKKCLRCKEKTYVYTNKHCRDCDRQRIVELGLKNKTKAVEHKGGCCSRCGYNKCLSALEFHHIDTKEKDANFNTMKYWCWERIEKELENCILVCSNCHREIHAEMRELSS